jgi:hypothetical protein
LLKKWRKSTVIDKSAYIIGKRKQKGEKTGKIYFQENRKKQ